MESVDMWAFRFDHTPFPGCFPRSADSLDEKVMIKAWADYMHSGPEDEPLESKILWMLDMLDYPTQEQAHWMATIFTWFGTNVGSADARNALKDGGSFVAMWAQNTVRVSSLNHGGSIQDHLAHRAGITYTLHLARTEWQMMYHLDQYAKPMVRAALDRRDRAKAIMGRKLGVWQKRRWRTAKAAMA